MPFIPESLTRDEAPVPKMVTEKITESLRASGYRALRAVVCHYHEGVAVLQGRVPSFYMKQVAQVQAGTISGVELVVNRLAVDSATDDR